MLAEADCEGMAGADAVGAELDAEPAYPVSALQKVQHVAHAAALNAYIDLHRSTGHTMRAWCPSVLHTVTFDAANALYAPCAVSSNPCSS